MTLLDDEQKYAEIFTDTERWGRRSQWPYTRRRGTAQLSFMDRGCIRQFLVRGRYWRTEVRTVTIASISR